MAKGKSKKRGFLFAISPIYINFAAKLLLARPSAGITAADCQHSICSIHKDYYILWKTIIPAY